MVVKICITEYNAAIFAISKHNSATIIGVSSYFWPAEYFHGV